MIDFPLWTFVVPGAPAPKPVGPPDRGSAGFLAYQAYRDAIAWTAHECTSGSWLQGPMRLSCHFGMPIPASWPDRRRRQALLLQVLPTGKPDLNDLIAAVTDSLTGVLYSDDSPIVLYGDMLKVYRSVPSTFIAVEAKPEYAISRHLMTGDRLLKLQTHRLLQGLSPNNAQGADRDSEPDPQDSPIF